jgi:hypothetical protein
MQPWSYGAFPCNRRDFISDSSWGVQFIIFERGKKEMRRTALHIFVAISAATLTANAAMATGNIHSSWEAFYGFGDANPVDDSLTDAGSTECQLCHLESNGGQPWNAYGWELHLNNVDFGAADIVDSDGDGTINGEEIEFLNVDGYGAQPGWTSDPTSNPGNVECVDQGPNFGCLPIPEELVPATAGPLDVPEPAAMLQLASGAIGLAWLHRRRNARLNREKSAPATHST